MRDGFIRVAAATPEITVADVDANARAIRQVIRQAREQEVKLLVLPELCLTGYTCGDLFLQELLLKKARRELVNLALQSASDSMITVMGVPLRVRGKLYNCAAYLYQGTILGIVPKTYLPTYSEFYEGRHFSSAKELQDEVWYIDFPELSDGAARVPFGTRLLLVSEECPDFVIAAEICEDLWVPDPPGVQHALAGATVLVNLSASVETTTKEGYRRNLVNMQSARLLCAYLYANAGEGESTTDVVYSAHNLICENGTVLAQSQRFQNQMIYAEIDLGKLAAERARMTTFRSAQQSLNYVRIPFHMALTDTELTRHFSTTPFVPGNAKEREQRCDEILNLQAMGLKKRLSHISCRTAVIGISGGLDSTLALLVTVRAFDRLGWSRKRIIGVTMPCFGTTDRTYRNACKLVRTLGAELKEIPVAAAVEQHFKDIEQPVGVHDVTYENSQARERTQVLMDVANQQGGIVVGTGDMSELALGWATYNGDHMSMYAVNASVPKTLVRHLVRYYADTCKEAELSEVLLDVLDTPVSPELLPPENGKISQKTEAIVGPYELHDFFLYYTLRFGYPPKKLLRVACRAFADKYDKDVVQRWLYAFYKRFFAQQYKRSCIPDGPKVGSVALSPRGDLRMPSDASVRMWLQELEPIGEGEFDA